MSDLVRIVIEKHKLERVVSLHGIGSKESIEQSQKLDKLIVSSMLKQTNFSQQI